MSESCGFNVRVSCAQEKDIVLIVVISEYKDYGNCIFLLMLFCFSSISMYYLQSKVKHKDLGRGERRKQIFLIDVRS